MLTLFVNFQLCVAVSCSVGLNRGRFAWQQKHPGRRLEAIV